jgi:hypothetical protein
MHLHGEAGDAESGQRQSLQVVQLFDVAVADLPFRFVAPQIRPASPVSANRRGVPERRVPASRNEKEWSPVSFDRRPLMPRVRREVLRKRAEEEASANWQHR